MSRSERHVVAGFTTICSWCKKAGSRFWKVWVERHEVEELKKVRLAPVKTLF